MFSNDDYLSKSIGQERTLNVLTKKKDYFFNLAIITKNRQIRPLDDIRGVEPVLF